MRVWSGLVSVFLKWFKPPAMSNAAGLRLNHSSTEEAQTQVIETDDSVIVPYADTVGRPYEEGLHQRMLTQWQFGDWDSLTCVEALSIEEHPQRATLALMAGAAHLQLNQLEQGKQWLRRAQNWGCSQRLLAEILVSGVHNSFAMTAQLAGQTERALSHFNAAVVATPLGGDVGLTRQARSQHQNTLLVARLGAPHSSASQTSADSQGAAEQPALVDQFVGTPAYLNCKTLDQTQLFNELTKHQTLELKAFDFDVWNASLYSRTQNDSDALVITEIFEREDFEFDGLDLGRALRRLYKTWLAQKIKPVVLDASANIGAACNYFLGKFPSARVVAMEQDPGNLEMLKLNCAGLDVSLFESAIRALATGLAQVLADFDEGRERLLFLKIDVWGGEDNVFAGDTGWLANVPLLIIELHDKVWSERDSSGNFYQTIAQHPFEVVPRGKRLLCFNSSVLQGQMSDYTNTKNISDK